MIDAKRGGETYGAGSSAHDVNGKNTALMPRQQIIDEIADDRIRLVSKFRDNSANQSTAAAVPLEIDCAVRGFAMDLGPAVRPTRSLVFGGNQIKSPELRISHDLVPQRATSGRDDLNHSLHYTPRFSRKPFPLQ